MAHTQTAHDITWPARCWTAITETFWIIRSAVAMSATAEARMARIEALNAKSDAELAQLGLSRDGIPAHVFGDLIHL